MRLLLDTHLLLWLALSPEKLSRKALSLIVDRENELYFSAISIWEIVIKRALDRPDFQVDPVALRASLIARGYQELPLTSEQALRVSSLPAIHRDIFDRVLIAQGREADLIFVTADADASKYPGQIIHV